MTPDELVAFLADVGDREWMQDAACRGMNPALFYPDHGVASKESKQVCHPCPVRDDCLKFAVEHNEIFGIWGGMADRERRPLRRAYVASKPELVPQLRGFARTYFEAAT